MKAEFSNADKLEDWAVNTVNPDKYDIYYSTLDRTLIAVKNVSTAPRLHGYVQGADIDEAQRVAKSVNSRLNVVFTWSWNNDETGGPNV